MHLVCNAGKTQQTACCSCRIIEGDTVALSRYKLNRGVYFIRGN
ncbi:MAG: hypothetical protein WA399_02935 [Acidobacteriaceae bacterium]